MEPKRYVADGINLRCPPVTEYLMTGFFSVATVHGATAR